MSHTNRDDYIENAKAMKNPTRMTNTKRIIHNINTVMKVLSTQPYTTLFRSTAISDPECMQGQR